MKKLLHERLREYGSNCRADYTDWSRQRHANELADEIEKYYIPRPRFEDGEPVQFGDEYKWADANIRKITGFGVTENGAPYVTCAFDGLGMSDAMIYSGSLKRPKPKMLDADGVEIKVGDLVWHISEPGKVGEVETLIPASAHVCVLWSTGAVLDTPGVDLTHREPDSLEKVQDTIDALANVYESDDRLCDDLHNISDRLTALIERGA